MKRQRAPYRNLGIAACAMLATLTAFAANPGRQAARSAELRQAHTTVTLPAGSVDGLAAAIAAAGPRGTVLVRSGLHTESGTVVIGSQVTIVGEPGAVIEADTTQAAAYPLAIVPVLHVLNTSDVTISALEIRPPAGQEGNTAVLVENSPDVTVAGNHFERHQFGVMIQRGDRVEVSDNHIEVSSTWIAGAVPEAHGVVVINGDRARISGNHVSGPLFGIWACDSKGHASNNTIEGPGYTGLILCNVPEGNFITPSGDGSGSDQPATEWHVQNNDSSGFFWGYMVTDGSHENVVVNNAASGNLDTDIEILGDSFLFGFLTPAAYDNVISVGRYKNLRVRDCGIDTIVGGNATLVDTGVEPCL